MGLKFVSSEITCRCILLGRTQMLAPLRKWLIGDWTHLFALIGLLMLQVIVKCKKYFTIYNFLQKAKLHILLDSNSNIQNTLKSSKQQTAKILLADIGAGMLGAHHAFHISSLRVEWGAVRVMQIHDLVLLLICELSRH